MARRVHAPVVETLEVPERLTRFDVADWGSQRDLDQPDETTKSLLTWNPPQRVLELVAAGRQSEARRAWAAEQGMARFPRTKPGDPDA